ncbi:hypothetical protein [Flexistipes sp.]|uniref:hypothetical protein n=1 Tax=Flexistipes sp. TaxID=3088135 RepID=UPI002E222BDF|nr:hypothetical protein [Flexistipes sp.]
MHEGCSGSFENGKEVVNKIRMMGFNMQYVPMPFDYKCTCGEEFMYETFEMNCPACGMTYGVTPCHAFDPANVMAAGRGY